MARSLLHVVCSLAALSSVHAYFLVGVKNFITTQRLDPIVSPGKVSGHAHSVLGGSNFAFEVDTDKLRNSECTSMPIQEDNSNYWFPHLYFQWNNGSFTSLSGGAVINEPFMLTWLTLSLSYYLYDNQPGKTTAFPDNFRMLSGDPLLRTYDPSSYAQQAVTFLCLDFNGVTTHHNELPNQSCPSGVRAQINFPSCWDGKVGVLRSKMAHLLTVFLKNTDSPDHKSHVAFRSGGPDTGDCSDPNFPVTLPRVFMEVYWDTEMDAHRNEAMNTTQPYVFAHGDRTGYGYHADFINGWKSGVLQKVVDNCHCNDFGDAQCCADQGLFTLNHDGTCRITDSIDEQTLGTLPKLPGNNPVQEEGTRATSFADAVTPPIISPVYVYTGNSPAHTGDVVTPASTAAGGATLIAMPSAAAPASSSSSASVAESTPAASGDSPASPTTTANSGSDSNSSSGSGDVPSSGSSTSSTSGSESAPASGSESSASNSESNGSGSENAASSASPESIQSASESESTPASGSESSSNGSSTNNESSSDPSPATPESSSVVSGSQATAVSGSSNSSSGSSDSDSNNSGSDSGSFSSSAASAASTCGGKGGRKHRHIPGQHGSPASGAAPQNHYKRRSLHKARHFNDHSRFLTPYDF
ncbi:hypothetical protein VKT23_008253 [Stygiomarasmius scandens]|uniref:DUF1996 domain-containing protein n=1 Tax=Marasmiellus scandens TaxID=2682957 RepID=A0ABR1JII8_9AGAR